MFHYIFACAAKKIYSLHVLSFQLMIDTWCYQQMSPFEGAPEEFDQTIFAVWKDRTLGPAEELALNLVEEQQRWLLMVCASFT